MDIHKAAFIFLMGAVLSGRLLAESGVESQNTGVAQGLLEPLTSLPGISQVQLSPDGQHIASLVRVNLPDKKSTFVKVQSIGENKTYYPLVREDSNSIVTRVRWANNNILLAHIRPLPSADALRIQVPELVTLDFERNVIKPIFPKSWSRSSVSFFRERIVDHLPGDDNHILLGVMRTLLSDIRVRSLDGRFFELGSREQKFDLRSRSLDVSSFEWGSRVLKLDLTTGRLITIKKERQGVVEWITDRQNRIRVAVRLRPLMMQYAILMRGVNGKHWKTMWTGRLSSEDQAWPLGFDEDPNVLYVRAYNEGKLAIFKMDLTSNSLEKELVFHDVEHDIEGSLLYSSVSGSVIGTSYSDGGCYTFWDEEYKALQKRIDKVLPDTTNRVCSFSRDERRYIVLATEDASTYTYLVGDQDTDQLRPIAHSSQIVSME